MLEWEYDKSLDEESEKNMKTFEYEAMVANGENQCGTLEAETQKDAIAKIRDMGMFPTKVREALIEQPYEKDYLEYLAETFGKKLIAWGKALTGDK
jgi:type II secretory pathway component PulF